MWEEKHARLDYVTWIIHPVLDDLHSSLNIGAWQDKKSGRYFWLGPLLFTLIFRLFSVYLLCCQHYSHICSCLFMSFHLLTKPYYVTIKGGDWLPGLPGGSPAAWWRRCHRRPWRPPPQLPRCGRNGRCRRRCWRRWTSPCLSESKCVCVRFSNISSARLLMIWRAWLDCTSFRPNFASHLSVGRLGLPWWSLVIVGFKPFQRWQGNQQLDPKLETPTSMALQMTSIQNTL